MARGEWGHNSNSSRCSYKRTTLIVCSFNIVVALYVLHSLYISLYIYPFPDSSQNSFRYSADQIKKMEESNRIRKALEPKELIKLVAKLKEHYEGGGKAVELPRPLKHKLTNELIDRLRSLNASANATEQIEAVETWRKEKLEEASKLVDDQNLTSTISLEEAEILSRALSSDWPDVAEDIGLWIPVEVVHKEHDDKPEGEEEFDIEILPGRELPHECHAELHTDYGGAAVRWGLTHPKESAYDCCMSCLDQAKRARPDEMKCNIWVYCPSETGCFSPDIYEHKNGECWLKYAETPKVTFKDTYSEAYRDSHPKAPVIVPWAAGVVTT